MKESKQVIVIRKDLNMRKGKMIAQGAHASGSWMAQLIKDSIESGKIPNLNKFQHQWISERFKKICVYVNSEEDLENIYQKAKEIELNVVKIIDSGLTEFNGIPTFTCVGIGPDDPDKIDSVTGNLPLL